ncbi:hypothetical protein [Vibrio furnissii]|uniref:hypothetical protein n=1 Tax=Vibrio furnissii TaxID=29494 RepID=UPI001EEBE846|nr:hypothetical protein [Vibrio furnissii]
MKVKPMIFNTEMVKALLDGRKSVTRRPVKIDYESGMKGPVVRGENGEVSTVSFAPVARLCPFGNVGDLLYVRETFRLYNNSDECGCPDHCSCPPAGTPLYFATHNDGESKWKPSIHMPRWASRITLKVTNVRIEKLSDMRKSDEQVKKEGFENWPQFKYVWESIYGQSKPNDYVWVIEFEVIHQNVDKYLSSLSLSEK